MIEICLNIDETTGKMTVSSETADQEAAEQQGGQDTDDSNGTPVNSLSEAIAAIRHLAEQALQGAGGSTDMGDMPDAGSGSGDDEESAMMGSFRAGQTGR